MIYENDTYIHTYDGRRHKYRKDAGTLRPAIFATFCSTNEFRFCMPTLSKWIRDTLIYEKAFLVSKSKTILRGIDARRNFLRPLNCTWYVYQSCSRGIFKILAFIPTCIPACRVPYPVVCPHYARIILKPELIYFSIS